MAILPDHAHHADNLAPITCHAKPLCYPVKLVALSCMVQLGTYKNSKMSILSRLSLGDNDTFDKVLLSGCNMHDPPGYFYRIQTKMERKEEEGMGWREREVFDPKFLFGLFLSEYH